jgi:hypothetical protein
LIKPDAGCDEGQRILAGAITERLTLTSSGAFVPMTPGSTKADAAACGHRARGALLLPCVVIRGAAVFATQMIFV